MSMSHGKVGRRQFVGTTSGLVALGVVGSFSPGRGWTYADESQERVQASVTSSVAVDDAKLRGLALEAIEAARALGAQFADVRVEIERFMRIEAREGRMVPVTENSAALGLRAVVEGSWGFAGASDLSKEGVQALARLAVERARAARPRSFVFAPAPVVRDGRWATPIETDPFTVPIRQQQELILEAVQGVLSLKTASARITRAGATNFWIRSERVLASSEGSFIAQRVFTAAPSVGVAAQALADDRVSVGLGIDELSGGGYGYEAITRVNLKEGLARAAQEALRVASLPMKSVDVGRYDVVLSPQVTASVLVSTVGRALELDRALGEHAAGSGTTYAMPPQSVLGNFQLGSPLLTVRGDRSRSHGSATVGWDDEGVQAENFVLVQDGVIVDYVTTRRTAPALASWYESRRQPLRSHGCTVGSGATGGIHAPALRLPNLTLHPGQGNARVEDLIKDVKRGFYIVQSDGVSVDQQCLNTQLNVRLAYEIRNGKLGGLARDMACQFNTPAFWRSLSALGGAASAEIEQLRLPGLYYIDVQAVPALFRQVNVVNTGKQA